MSDLESVRKAVLKIFTDNPDREKWNIRSLYYKLVSIGLISNKKLSYNCLCKQLVKLRERGEIVDSVFIDASRKIIESNITKDTLEEYFDRWLEQSNIMDELFLKDRWDEQQYNLVIALEKEGLSSVVSKISLEYRIPLVITKGYISRTTMLRLGRRLKPDKKNVILLLSDFDASGYDWGRSLGDKLKQEGYEFEMYRIGLTPEQTQQYHLIEYPGKPKDTRSKKFIQEYGMNVQYEIDSLDYKDLQKLTKQSIEKYIEWDIWNTSIKQETQDKAKLKERFNATITNIKKDMKK